MEKQEKQEEYIPGSGGKLSIFHFSYYMSNLGSLLDGSTYDFKLVKTRKYKKK